MNSIKKINAVCVNCINEDDVLTLAVGDDKDEPQNFFIIGRFDEDNLSVDECIGFQSDATKYEIPSAIERAELNNMDLVIVINDSAANKAGAKYFYATLVDSTDKKKLVQYLHEIFEGSSIKLVIK